MCEDYAPNELCAHHCIAVPGSYRCECNPGYRLMADKRNCIEVRKRSPALQSALGYLRLKLFNWVLLFYLE